MKSVTQENEFNMAMTPHFDTTANLKQNFPYNIGFMRNSWQPFLFSLIFVQKWAWFSSYEHTMNSLHHGHPRTQHKRPSTMTPRKLSKGRKSGDSDTERLRPRTNEPRPRTKSRKKIGLTRSERVNIEDGDALIHPSTAPEARRSVDVVVVDIHNENKGFETKARVSPKPRRSRDEGRACWSAEAVPPRDIINSVTKNRRRRGLLEKGNAWEIDESVDAIEEFEDLDSASGNSENFDPRRFGSSEKFLASSEDDSDAEEMGMRKTEEPRRRRKRWSKEGRNLHLTEELIGNSSAETDSSRFKPVPAPRKKQSARSFAVESESSLAFDNGGFKSDTDEVLRIETEVYEPQEAGCEVLAQSTKMEMASFYDSYEKVVESISLDSENNSGGGKKESFRASGFPDTSDGLETEIVRGGGSACTPKKGRREDPADEYSEPSENEDLRISKSNTNSERESTNFDTENSFTDISDLPARKREPIKLEESETKVKKRRSKRRAKSEDRNEPIAEDLITEYNSEKAEKFVSVTIHKADVLETDYITRHPMVKVHLVEMNTGNYLKTLNSDNHGRCSYLQPMITRKFDFKENRSILPNWQEELIFEHNFKDVVKPGDKPVLILFEILDLLNFAEASFKYNVLGNEGCWHKIAWAFLKPIGANGVSHVNKKLRLQLYEPSKLSKKSARPLRCEVFNWWRSTSREKYPSTLYVTLKPVDPPIEEPIVYERFSLSEVAQDVEDESLRNSESCRKSSDLVQLPKWSRLAAQSCKIPNSLIFQSENYENGSFHVAFSNDGKYLASVGSEEENDPIVIHTIPDGSIHLRLKGHKNFVYALSWSGDDRLLLSVSSDQTGCIWDVGSRTIQEIEMLPHPSYVYCGKFYPLNKNIVVTGCYDSVTRVWTKSRSTKRYELSQELDKHKGYVNAICFQKDGGLITADSLGVIMLWTLKKREWRVFKTIKNNEMENIIVNTVVPHPFGGRLLIHSRDNGLRMIDLETGVVLQRYRGLRNRRLQTTACLSPCGGLVLCGGEDSSLTVWNLESGRRAAKYAIKDARIVACVAYHPLDHILAFSTFGSVSSVQILRFDKNSTGESVGLSLLGNGEMSDDVDITVKFDKNDLSSGDNLSTRSKRAERRIEGLSRAERGYCNENTVSRQDFLRLKIQRLNESQEGLKSRSAVRLNNIIEKIDKILVNTTLKRDLDSTQSSNETRKREVGQTPSTSKRDARSKVRSRSSKSRNRDRSSTNEELLEMQDMSLARRETSGTEESKRKLLRSISRPSTQSHSDLESDEDRSARKSSGESMRRTSGRKNVFDVDVESNRERKPARRRTRRRRGEGRPSESSDRKSMRDSESCVIVLEDMKHRSQSNPSTSDSAGTYTIDKDEFSNIRDSDKKKGSDASSSAKSNATFTIENEISSGARSVTRKSSRSIRE